jgi:hypothetical protein
VAGAGRRLSDSHVRLLTLVAVAVAVGAGVAGGLSAWSHAQDPQAWAPVEGPPEVWQDGGSTGLAASPGADSFGIWVVCEATWLCSGSGEHYHLADWLLSISAAAPSGTPSRVSVAFSFGCPGTNASCAGGPSTSQLVYNFTSGVNGSPAAEEFQAEAYYLTVTDDGPSPITVVWSASATFSYGGL